MKSDWILTNVCVTQADILASALTIYFSYAEGVCHLFFLSSFTIEVLGGYVRRFPVMMREIFGIVSKKVVCRDY
jgi:hypothetical protein